MEEWIAEKNIIAQDESYRSAKTIHSKWTRHQAFDAEVASNKDRMFSVQEVRKFFLWHGLKIYLITTPQKARFGPKK